MVIERSRNVENGASKGSGRKKLLKGIDELKKGQCGLKPECRIVQDRTLRAPRRIVHIK